MKVKFSDVGEFLGELKTGSTPPSKIVRLTRSMTRDRTLPMWHSTVIAGFVNGRGELVELSRYMGEWFNKDSPDSQKVEEACRQAMDRIEEEGRSLGMDVRAGRYEE